MTSPKQADELLMKLCDYAFTCSKADGPRLHRRLATEVKRLLSSPAVPEGYVIVPKQPSAKHWEDVAFNLSSEFGPGFVASLERFAKAFWREMLNQLIQPPSAPPAHSKSEYKRLSAMGVPTAPPVPTCGCIETYPQLVPGVISHGLGCTAPPKPTAQEGGES